MMILNLEDEDTTMTPKQRKKALNEGEMPPCVGSGNAKCFSPPQNIMIQGYDDKLRCPPCNKIHQELVFKEAGEGVMPDSVSPTLAAKTASAEDVARRRDILMRAKSNRRGGTSVAEAAATIGRIENRPAMTEDERRAAVRKKYQKSRA